MYKKKKKKKINTILNSPKLREKIKKTKTKKEKEKGCNASTPNNTRVGDKNKGCYAKRNTICLII